MEFSDITALRAHRNSLLQESDVWLLEDYPLSKLRELALAEIYDYRTELRNWPATETNLANATVPQKPTL